MGLCSAEHDSGTAAIVPVLSGGDGGHVAFEPPPSSIWSSVHVEALAGPDLPRLNSTDVRSFLPQISASGVLDLKRIVY